MDDSAHIVAGGETGGPAAGKHTPMMQRATLSGSVVLRALASFPYTETYTGPRTSGPLLGNVVGDGIK